MLRKVDELVVVRLLDFDPGPFEDQLAQFLRVLQTFGNLILQSAMLLPVIKALLVQWAIDWLQVLLGRLEVDI